MKCSKTHFLFCTKYTAYQNLPAKVYKKSTIIKIKTSKNPAILIYCKVDKKP